MKNVIIYIVCTALFGFISACSSASNPYYSTSNASVKASKGPTESIDLEEVGPPGIEVLGRFDVSKDGDFIVCVGKNSSERWGSDQQKIWTFSRKDNRRIELPSSDKNQVFASPCLIPGTDIIMYTINKDIYSTRSSAPTISSLHQISSGDYDGEVCAISPNELLYVRTPAVYVNGPSVGLYQYMPTRSPSYKSSVGSMIWKSNIDGTELKSMRAGNNPRWSPVGEGIVFEFEGDIFMLNPQGTNLVQITNTPNIVEALPDFSPDGKRIVYTSNEGTYNKVSNTFNLWIVNADGTGKTRLTNHESFDSWPVWRDAGIFFLSTRSYKWSSPENRIWLIKL